MSPETTEEEAGVDRLRALAEGLVRRVGGFPAVRTLMATLTVYDGAGGGLMASGLAYAALVALLPGLLVMVSVLGFVISDAATQEQLVAVIASAIPPLEDVARTAFAQVSAGAVPTGIIGFVGLLWGASRFYAALDYAFSRIFRGTRRRNEVERTFRGLIVTALLVVAPLGALLVGSLAGWIVETAPGGIAGGLWQLATPVGSFLLFVAGTALVFRFVPGSRLPGRAYVRPAILVGLALAAFSQVFTFIAPLMTKIASIYSPFVAVFALLAWLAISFNVLLLGASWTRVRALALGHPGTPAADPADPGMARSPRSG
jgi:YihY family inner membrane protein